MRLICSTRPFSHSPQVGIWWTFHSVLAIFVETHDLKSINSNGAELQFRHELYWEQAAALLDVFPRYRYTDIPRGCVVCEGANRFVILHGNRTHPLELERIAKAFQLPHWTARLDSRFLMDDVSGIEPNFS